MVGKSVSGFFVRIFWKVLSPKHREITYPRHRRIVKKSSGDISIDADNAVPALVIRVPTHQHVTTYRVEYCVKCLCAAGTRREYHSASNILGCSTGLPRAKNGVGVGTGLRCLRQRRSKSVNAGVHFVFRRFNQLSFYLCRDIRKSCVGMQCLVNMSCQFWFPDNGQTKSP